MKTEGPTKERFTKSTGLVIAGLSFVAGVAICHGGWMQNYDAPEGHICSLFGYIALGLAVTILVVVDDGDDGNDKK